MTNKTLICFSLLAGVVALAVFGISTGHKSENNFNIGSNPALPTFSFYTALSATSPQLPFWLAVKEGRLQDIANFQVRTWKTGEQLKTMALHGQGDFWVGHTEALAQVKKLGGPVRMVLISTWKKFYLLGPRSEENFSWTDLNGQDIVISPPISPAAPLLKRLAQKHNFQAYLTYRELEHFLHVLKKRQTKYIVVPEPFASLIVAKAPQFQILKSLEEEFSADPQHQGLPVAGIAVNENTFRNNKQAVSEIAKAMLAASAEASPTDAATIEAIPAAFLSAIPMAVNRISLTREDFNAFLAARVQKEIYNYLQLSDIDGEFFKQNYDFLAEFFVDYHE